MNSWTIGGRRWAEFPSDPALVQETELARDRDDQCADQWEQARHWLEDHGINTKAAVVDLGALKAAIASAFPEWSAKLANEGGRPPVADWDVVKEEAIRLMEDNGDFG